MLSSTIVSRLQVYQTRFKIKKTLDDYLPNLPTDSYCLQLLRTYQTELVSFNSSNKQTPQLQQRSDVCCVLQQERAQQLRVVRERFPQVSTVKLCPLFQVSTVVLEGDDNFVYVAPNHLQSVLYQALRRRGSVSRGLLTSKKRFCLG